MIYYVQLNKNKMKKVILSFAMIVIAFVTVNTVMAQTVAPIAPECTYAKYPGLYERDFRQGKTAANGDVITKVTMTVPLSNIRYSVKDSSYYVIHPIFGNECGETESKLNDSDDEITEMMKIVQKYPRAFLKMSVAIQLKSVNGKNDGVWRKVGQNTPQYPEDL